MRRKTKTFILVMTFLLAATLAISLIGEFSLCKEPTGIITLAVMISGIFSVGVMWAIHWAFDVDDWEDEEDDDWDLDEEEDVFDRLSRISSEPQDQEEEKGRGVVLDMDVLDPEQLNRRGGAVLNMEPLNTDELPLLDYDVFDDEAVLSPSKGEEDVKVNADCEFMSVFEDELPLLDSDEEGDEEDGIKIKADSDLEERETVLDMDVFNLENLEEEE